jgi:hypothetical protein
VYHLLPHRKKNKFKVSGVRTNVPRMLMVHHQDVFVEISTRQQTAQQEMVAGEASDLYTSDTCTWSATSSGPGAKDEPAVNNHSPSDSGTR